MFDRGRSMGLASPFPRTLRGAVSCIIRALEQNTEKFYRQNIGTELYTRGEEKCLVCERKRVMF